MESFVLHEDHVSHFETAHKILNRGAQVATTSPNIFDKSDVVRVDSQRLRQPPIVELNALILEEMVLIWLVKDLDAKHDEATVVAACQSDVVQVVEARAELRTNQRIGGWVQLTCDTVGLEAKDARRNVVNVIAPPCNYRISLNRVARDPRRSERLFKAYKANDEKNID